MSISEFAELFCWGFFITCFSCSETSDFIECRNLVQNHQPVWPSFVVSISHSIIPHMPLVFFNTIRMTTRLIV